MHNTNKWNEETVKKESFKAGLHNTFRHVHLSSKRARTMIVAFGVLVVVAISISNLDIGIRDNTTVAADGFGGTSPGKVIGSNDVPTIVFFEDFTGQGDSAYPAGWTCHDNRGGTCYFDVCSETLRAMDHQIGDNVYGWKSFARTITKGQLTFDFNDGGYSVGSDVADHYVTLQPAGGTDVLTIDITTDRDGNFITLKLNGAGGNTHFTESVRYNVTLEFNAGAASLYVDDVLEVATTYTSQALGRLYLGTSIAMHGLGVFFDNFVISEDFVVFDEDFTGQGDSAYPEGWTCHDNRDGSCYFDVCSETLRAMDHQNGDNVYGWKSFVRAITSGWLSFSFDSLGGYSVGSDVADHYVTLQTAGGTDVLTIGITTDRDGNFITLKLNGAGGSTHFPESERHNSILEFNAGAASLYVDGLLEASITYTSQALGRLYLGTSIDMHGLGIFFDDFLVFEDAPDFDEFELDLTSSTTTFNLAGNTGISTLTVKNSGITPLKVHLATQSLAYGTASFSTNDFVLKAGETKTVTMTISPNQAYEHETDAFNIVATAYLVSTTVPCALVLIEDDASGPSIPLVVSYRYWAFVAWSDIFIWVNDPSGISSVQCYFSAHGVWQSAHWERNEGGNQVWHITSPAGAWYGNGDNWFYVLAYDNDAEHSGDKVYSLITIY